MNTACVTILIIFSAFAHAGAITDVNAQLASRIKDPELRDMTERVLRQMNTDYSGLADRRLQAKGEQFDHARLEITGVMSKDDTRDFDKSSFDAFVKPSFVNKHDFWSPVDAIKRMIDPTHDALLDVNDYQEAAAGIMTKRATEVLEQYKDKRINEIVAHSWGTELIYAAILNGGMRPPKKLIVVGVPDDDFGKWEELARRTGTAVVWVRAQNDLVAKNGTPLVNAMGKVDFKSKWDAVCAAATTRIICHPYGRPPAVAVRIEPKQIPGLVGHGRKEYFDYLKTWNLMSRGHADLRADERAVKLAEVNVIQQDAFNAALQEARVIVAKAREQAAIAKHDHEERLKNRMADLATRSCSSPGSVTQADLDALPASRKEEYQTFTTLPRGLDSCSISVYSAIGMGAEEADILRLSMRAPAPVVAAPSPPPAADVVAGKTFESILPRLQEFAGLACKYQGNVPLPKELFTPRVPYFFTPRDEAAFSSLTGGLGKCESRVFRRLFETVRDQRGDQIDERWLMQAVADPPPPAVIIPPAGEGGGGGSRVPTGCIPGDRSRRNCIACGNRYCP